MLKSNLIIILSFLSFAIKAEISDPIGVFNEGNQFYETQDYEAAKNQYLILVNEQLYSTELFRNLGNTYYKLDDIPNSILYFEKALKLAPGNEDLIHNLKLSNTQIADKNSSSTSVRLDDWFFTLIGNNPNYWANNSIYLFALGFALLILYLFAAASKMKKLSFYTRLVAIVFGIVSIVFASLHKSKLSTQEEAIVFEPSVDLKNEPSENSSTAFVLHEGSKVTLLNQNEKWYEVKFGDGKIGWILKDFVQTI